MLERKLIGALLPLLCVGLVTNSAEAGRLYWTDSDCSEGSDFCVSSDRIRSSELDGSDVQVELDGLFAKYYGITLGGDSNLYTGSAYCDEEEGFDHGVRRMSSQGCQKIVGSSSRVDELKVDLGANKLYWIVADDHLRRADLDTGANAETLVSATNALQGLALDPVNDKLYWGSRIGDLGIFRSDLDGSNPSLLIPDASVQAIDVDGAAGHIYWLSGDAGGMIRRADLDGTNQVDIVAAPLDSSFNDLELDLVNGKIYWLNSDLCDAAEAEILRADLDGANVEVVVMADNPIYGIAIDPVGDSVGPLACSAEDVPTLSPGGATLLSLLLIATSGYLVRRRAGRVC